MNYIQFDLYSFLYLYQNHFGKRLLLLLSTLSIRFYLLSFTINLHMRYCLVPFLITPILESLDVLVLYFFTFLNNPNYNLMLIFVVFLGMTLLIKVIDVMVPFLVGCVFLVMKFIGNINSSLLSLKLLYFSSLPLRFANPFVDLFLECPSNPECASNEYTSPVLESPLRLLMGCLL